MKKIVPTIIGVIVLIAIFLGSMMFAVSSEKEKSDILSSFNSMREMLRQPVSVTEVSRMSGNLQVIDRGHSGDVTLPGDQGGNPGLPGGTTVPPGNMAVSKYPDTAPFLFPLPDFKYVSSSFGGRIHPVTGTPNDHSGVDLAANAGTPILAADTGTVYESGFHNTMGNYIKIDHGNGYVTVYMHASALYVSTGQTVTRGEVIAAVGSTGRSTGPHLHLTIKFNGTNVDPEDYLPGPLPQKGQ